MNHPPAGTNPATRWTSRAWLQLAEAVRAGAFWPAAALWCGFSLLVVTMNAISVNADFANRGLQVGAWEPWLWEYSSALGLLSVFPAIWWIERRLAAAAGPIALRLAAGMLLVVPFSAIHVAVMTALRRPVYAIMGLHYRFGGGATMIYEFRKDVVTFLLLSGFVLSWRALQRRPAPAPAVPDLPLLAEPSFLIPARGGATLVRAAQIDWVEAQGNYVALHVGPHAHLLRQPMKQVEETLSAMRFVRTHRSALVNLARVTGTVREDERDFIRVGDHRAPLSDSRRDAVIRALSTGQTV